MDGWVGHYENRAVLVTGAGGFIGSHLVELLAAAGARVRAMIHYSSRADTGNLEFLPPRLRSRVQTVRGDVRDPFFMNDAVKDVDTVFHLAALIGIPYSYVAPADYVATNVQGTLNVLEAARQRGVGRVVHTSTSETYGTAQYRPIDEKHPLVGQSPYAATKIGADKLAESYHRSFELPVVTVRPFNTYGPRQSGRAVVQTILCQVQAGARELRLGSLDPERDLTFVTDTARGMMALGACGAAIGQTVNLGTGSALTVGQIVETCLRIAGRTVPIVTDAARVRPEASEVRALVSDNRWMKELTGWSPVTDLETGLRQCLEFHQRHPGFYSPEEYQR